MQVYVQEYVRQSLAVGFVCNVIQPYTMYDREKWQMGKFSGEIKKYARDKAR